MWRARRRIMGEQWTHRIKEQLIINLGESENENSDTDLDIEDDSDSE
jgi:hypothetical protein